MATRSTMVYSAAALRRMLSLSPSVPVQLQEFFDVIWVWVKGQRPTFISKTRFKQHFVDHRKAEAQPLQVTDWLREPPRFTVTNPTTRSRHIVDCIGDRIECDCEDYYWQIQHFGHGCCKHGYAVLHYLGFDSLKQYQHVAVQNAWDSPLPQVGKTSQGTSAYRPYPLAPPLSTAPPLPSRLLAPRWADSSVG